MRHIMCYTRLELTTYSLVLMGIEHDRIHLENSSVLMPQHTLALPRIPRSG
jgi:hypothetical protein